MTLDFDFNVCKKNIPGGSFVKKNHLRKIVAAFFFMSSFAVYSQEAAPDASITDDAPVAEGEAALLLDAPPPAEDPRAGESSFSLDAGQSNGVGAASFFVVLRMVLVLVVVAAASYGVIYFLKRTQKNKLSENQYLKVLASAPVNAKNQVAVVAVGGKAYLIGTGESSVSFLAEITDKETVDALMLNYTLERSQTNSGVLNFKSLLQNLGVKTGNGGASGLGRQRERLKGL
ncbi:MAG: flagellar biosynthetic protein FliO [Spirochaetaceae bacterium]|jgi:flagellar protein FliO/FliZ|nr:flagellar biosynthetic protein FliO [Spirochaetaceae bacterium]